MAGHPADHPGPLAFVADLEAPELDEAEAHHLRRVLRLRDGAPLTIGDGRGSWRVAALTGVGVEPHGPIHREPAPAPRLTVAFAVVKGDKPELVVQKLTEVGVDRIVLLRTARSVVRWDAAKAAKAVERLRLVARAAAAQSHRPHLPEVAGLAELGDVTAFDVAGAVALATRDGDDLVPAHTTVVVGPEGGWAPEELGLGLPVVRLGPNVLRAETAAIAAGVLLAARHGR